MKTRNKLKILIKEASSELSENSDPDMMRHTIDTMSKNIEEILLILKNEDKADPQAMLESKVKKIIKESM